MTSSDEIIINYINNSWEKIINNEKITEIFDFSNLTKKNAQLVGKNNISLLMIAINISIEFVNKLIEYGAYVNYKNKNGWTPLMICARYNLYDMAELLIKNNAVIDLQNDDKWTALMISVRYHNNDIASLLINNNANLDLGNDSNWTAIMIAVIYSNKKILKSIILRHANLDIQDKNGFTAVMHAAINGEYDIVEMLIEYGCDLQLKTRRNKLAADIAKTDNIKRLLQANIIPTISIHKNDICGACLIEKPDMLFTACGHISICRDCYINLKNSNNCIFCMKFSHHIIQIKSIIIND